MKKVTFSLIIAILVAVTFLNSCKPDVYAPSLKLKLEPYLVYYDNAWYTIYDQQGNIDPNIPDEVLKMGDIHQYVDLNTNMKYTIDDNAEFWTTAYLNNNYEYPKYEVSAYSKNTPTVTVKYDETMGVENGDGIDLGLTGVYKITYSAVDEGNESKKYVNVRVYNSYKNMTGIYTSRLYKINTGTGGLSLWGQNYNFGEAKVVKFEEDFTVDKKIKVNRFLNNGNLKGVIKGELTTFPTECVVGNKKEVEGETKTVIEILVKGSVVENDAYIYGAGSYGSGGIADQIVLNYCQQNGLLAQITSIFNEVMEKDTISTETLVVFTNRTLNNVTQGEISEISLVNTDGESIAVPFVSVQYKVERFKSVSSTATQYDYELTDGTRWVNIDSPGRIWTSTFLEMFVKQIYWYNDANKANISAISETVISGISY
ncbi:MAG: hypothetical protein JXR60_06365 [Bacteroidales bacterium]|nr:hypothetical protein [Bacteroidales bacterium]